MFVDWLQSYMPMLTLIWLFPIVFMFHDFEEILTVENWTKQNKDAVMKKLRPFFRRHLSSSFQLTTLQFARNVFWLFLAIVIASLLAALYSFYFPFLMFLALFFAHVFTHIGQAIYVRRYTPGLISSVVLVLPYSSYVYYRLLGEAVTGWADVIWSASTMAGLLPVLLFFLIRARNRLKMR
ncbi:HXXEE domain-containing protein [Alkalihalobacillus oceani]|uniref:HXXEE domain-containing protein n=1 Tax=Halalkalibacter oceani TaxID=1653776 RepID=A0A9X2IPY6_9BACI|nr:HXXEE domain-containing protein [Halalkalibacter oceani]MCM3714922.1 HXXEE domain-containing protein [Halalkalibacter oceani]